MKEIFTGGPIVCSIAATPDFDNNYPSFSSKNQGVFIEMADLPKDKVQTKCLSGVFSGAWIPRGAIIHRGLSCPRSTTTWRSWDGERLQRA